MFFRAFTKIYVAVTTAYSAYSMFNGSNHPVDFNKFLVQKMSSLNASELLTSLSELRALNFTSDLALQSLHALLNNTTKAQLNSSNVIEKAQENLRHINTIKDIINIAQQGKYNEAWRLMIEFSSKALHLTSEEIMRATQITEESKTAEQILHDLNVKEETLKNSIKSEEEKILQSKAKIKILKDELELLKQPSPRSQSFIGQLENQQQPSNHPDL